MRGKLKDIENCRQRFIGTFGRYGSKKGYKSRPVKTLLFTQITDTKGKEISDHIWFTTGKQFESLNLQPGDKISFDARVKEYTKGYKGRRENEYDSKPIEKDYKLSHPNNIVKHIEAKTGLLF